MPFSETQRTKFIGLLESKGWQTRDLAICSASGGLWFGISHFAHWSPSQMCEIFSRRAKRIELAQIGDWELASRENQEASWAAEHAMTFDAGVAPPN